uniref:Dystroglycan 1 n=1 Tax=Anopheles arabiensis TaxID=7173 RepID=A0A182HP29_ANOAR
MNLRYQETFCIIFLLCTSITLAEDFDFVPEQNDDVEPIAAEPPKVDSQPKLSKAGVRCLPTESTIQLSLILRAKSWKHVQTSLKQRTISKLAEYFLVPEESIIVRDATSNDLHKMVEKALQHGKKPSRTVGKSLGWIGFPVGCGEKMSSSAKETVRNVNTQLAELRDLTGMDFGWWIIWKEQTGGAAASDKRIKREVDPDDDYYDYDDDEAAEDDDEGETTEVPHAHRHHHGSSEPTSTQRSVSTFTTPKQDNEEEDKELEYENYDDEYDDEEEGAIELTTQPDPRVLSSTTTTERPMPSSTEPSTTPTTVTMPTTTPSTTTTTTTEAPTTTTTTTTSTTTTTTTTTTEASTTTSTMLTTELDEPTNLPPIIRNRIPKQAIPAGKVFRYQVPLETFHDNEDGNNLSLELLDARDQPLKPSSWIQFNEDTKEIYGLPLEKDVSRWPYKLRATDSGNLTVTEKVDIQVQQHKSHRSLNHEISLALRLNRKFASNVDWHIETARGISVVLGDVTLSNIIVRDIRNSIQDPSLATFVYTNETLPKDRCPEEKLDELVALLTEEALNDALNPDITVKSVQGQQIAQCTKVTPPKVKPTQSIQRNYAPQTRNQVDQVNATVGHLLVFKVPVDTFYDPEDGNELKMKLLTTDRNTLDPNHWLQFDSKNQEFYGVPRTNDIGRKEYLLMAEDREGLTATDALVVVVNPHHKRDYSVLFELTLDISHEQFNTAQVQRRFIERLAQVFGDASTHYIKIHHIRPIHHTGQVQVSFFNTTLSRQHQRCPQEEIETLRNILLHQDSTIRAKVREILGQEFSLQNVSLVPLDNCHGFDTPHHATSEPEKAAPKPISKDDYLLTFVLPSVIIIVMLLIAAIIACILYKRRLTGKMELGTDEERKSFRSKGIPVIFQDELDEKPEIGNKSPVILKDEKPPLLPPSYSSTNHDGDNEDVDEYVPPQPVIVGGRESRGKSPVTPSYRRPPPYVSP